MKQDNFLTCTDELKYLLTDILLKSLTDFWNFIANEFHTSVFLYTK